MDEHHPLTDEICDQIQDSIHPCNPADMRVAADWQLTQVIQFLEANKDLSVETVLRFIRPVMRPQVDNMSEHNLPDKDAAPWLDITYDAFKIASASE